MRAVLERLISTTLCLGLVSCGGGGGQQAPPPDQSQNAPIPLQADEVRAIMESAALATDREIAVAVTDRNGTILGVGTNFALDDPEGCAASACPAGATPDCADVNLAVQLARTAAFFSADQTPLTSRSVRFISDPHFPPEVQNTASAALFGIENTNRGCSFDAEDAAGADFLPGQAIPRARSLAATLRDIDGGPALRCENGDDPNARCGCSSGIATLPGGVPIYKNGTMAGGVGVAVRGTALPPDPTAAFDDPRILRRDDVDPDLDVAEFAARAFAGDDIGFPAVANKGLVSVCENTAVAPPACCADGTPCDFNILPARRLPFDPVIFIDGIEVLEIAKNPPVSDARGSAGLREPLVIDPATRTAALVSTGFLVGPKAATDAPPGVDPLSAADVEAIILAARDEALITRAAIRLPLEARTAMMLAVSDTEGELLGLFRMDDATIFSIDVAVAKSRNVIYFSSPAIDPIDALDSPGLTDTRGQAFAPGTAITNRTLSFAAQPFFPSGIDGSDPGPFRRVFIEDSATPCTNGRQPTNGRQNGIVFFPGSAPLYRDGVLVGGFGVSGDGVEQDDIVTAAGTRGGEGFEAPKEIRADNVFVRNVRLPYLKFNRQPRQ